MATLVVPSLDAEPWPTLGPQVCDFIEAHLVYGPGDLRGEPYRIAPDFRAFLFRAYEVFPKGHKAEGKRRFKRVGLSERKGLAKTEKAAIIAACELHPEAPVRADGFRKIGRAWVPVGRGVRDPYVPMVAYTEEQTEELAYGALKVILAESDLAEDFDIGEERILVLDDRGRAAGKAVALAGSPNARDGARTTFQHFDETHRFTLEGLRKAHRTMLANVPKRPASDPWSLETTTTYTPGERSVAESTHEYAEAVADGRIKDSRLFFVHRDAGDHDLSTPDGLRAAVVEASGAAAEWSDIDGIVGQWSDPDADHSYLERVWLNLRVRASDQAFDAAKWAALARPDVVIGPGELIVVGFDGSRFQDSTGLVATHVESGHQFVLGCWERPPTADDDWQVPEHEVDALVDHAFETWDVWRLYADPPYWENAVDRWRGRWQRSPRETDQRVISWWTNRDRAMAWALRAYSGAMAAAELTHDGDEALQRHIGNARRRPTRMRDDKGEFLWTIRKERPDSPKKIDLAMAGCLSWEARGDCIAAGELDRRRRRKSRAAGF